LILLGGGYLLWFIEILQFQLNRGNHRLLERAKDDLRYPLIFMKK